MAKKDGSKGKNGTKGNGVKDALKKAAGIVVQGVFGKPRSGFVGSQAVKLEAPLVTQKDGRLFAIELLKKITALAIEGPFSCVDEGEGDEDEAPFRFPPQTPVIREAFDRIYASSEAAKLGFFVVMTEELGGGRNTGHVTLKALEQWEREGRMRVMPEKSAEEKALETYDALAVETQSYLPSSQVHEIENFISNNGPTRRMAMAYLTKPWSEITNEVQKDRKLAGALANVLQSIMEGAGNYQLLADWMKEAQRRIAVTLATRGDMQELLAEEEAESKPFPEYSADKTPEQDEGYKAGAVVALKMLTLLQGGATKESAEGFLNDLIRVVALRDGINALQGFGDRLVAYMTHKEGGDDGE